MDLELTGKVALVTGGSKGIGLGIVRRLIAEGARVANVNRSEAEGRELEKQYSQQGKECFFIPGDLSDVQACQNAVAKTLERFGRIDILVNNAGVNDGVGLDAGVDAFLGSLRRNLIHVYALAHYALDSLKASRESSSTSVRKSARPVRVARRGTRHRKAASTG